MKKLAYSALACLALVGCTKENKDVVMATSPENLPLQIVLDADEDGNVEDDDKAEIAFTFTDKIDPTGVELGGITQTLSAPVLVKCQITDIEGFDNLADYIKEIKAVYEIDDCTEMDVDVTANLNTGEFSFYFPAGVEELVIEVELDEDLFDDDAVSEDRGFVVEVLGIEAASENVVINTATKFEYKVLDDELIFGEYELELNDDNLAKVKELFAGVNEDLAETLIAAIDAIEMEVSLEDVEFKIVLVEEEEDECEAGEFDNVEIEIEGELEELTDDALSGEIEFVVEVEEDNGAVEEFTFEGEFEINGEELTLTLSCEDLEVEEVTLVLAK